MRNEKSKREQVKKRNKISEEDKENTVREWKERSECLNRLTQTIILDRYKLS